MNARTEAMHRAMDLIYEKVPDIKPGYPSAITSVLTTAEQLEELIQRINSMKKVTVQGLLALALLISDDEDEE